MYVHLRALSLMSIRFPIRVLFGLVIVSIFAAVMARIIVGIQFYEAAHDIVHAL